MAMPTVVRRAERTDAPVPWGTERHYLDIGAGPSAVRLTTSTFPPGLTHAWHEHPDEWEVIFVLDGTCRHESEAGTFDLVPGDAVWIPAATRHRTTNPSPDRTMTCLVLKGPGGGA